MLPAGLRASLSQPDLYFVSRPRGAALVDAAGSPPRVLRLTMTGVFTGRTTSSPRAMKFE